MQKEAIDKAKKTLKEKFGLQADTYYVAYTTFVPLLIIPEKNNQISEQIHSLMSHCDTLVLKNVSNVHALEYGRTELDIYPIIRSKGTFELLQVTAIQRIEDVPEHILSQISSALTEDEFNKKKRDDHIAAVNLSQAYANLLTASNIRLDKLEK